MIPWCNHAPGPSRRHRRPWVAEPSGSDAATGTLAGSDA